MLNLDAIKIDSTILPWNNDSFLLDIFSIWRRHMNRLHITHLGMRVSSHMKEIFFSAMRTCMRVKMKLQCVYMRAATLYVYRSTTAKIFKENIYIFIFNVIKFHKAEHSKGLRLEPLYASYLLPPHLWVKRSVSSTTH